MTLEIPVIIPTFNNPTYLNSMLAQLKELNVSRIIVIDSHSTTPGMVSLLDSLSQGIEVVRLSQNHGPRYCFEADHFYKELPEHFCVTDPDLVFNERMPKSFMQELMDLSEQFRVGKAGLALDISNIAEMRTNKILQCGKEYNIWEWEEQFWRVKVGQTSHHDPIYSADIDTTFSLCNKRYFNLQNPYWAIRVAGRYTCKHIPWYKENSLPPQEEQEYRELQRHSSYFGGANLAPQNSNVGNRLTNNLLIIKRYGIPIWAGEKLTRWTGLWKGWYRIKLKMNDIDKLRLAPDKISNRSG
ncbi:MAG: glycosyltransferase [Hyphomicrobiales bacterium]|nr:glycosyltransferase [Hyphomicrobiales bacterium]